jgi:predicted ATPase/class 3 adenylate cyclase
MSTTLPTGAVTFLFTDIEGSTALWEQHPAAMPAMLARHHELVRQAVEAHHGAVFQIVGDAFHAAFAHPEQALAAAVVAQRALQAEFGERPAEPGEHEPPAAESGVPARAPQPTLHVRMAVHTGSAEVRQGDFVAGQYLSGPTLNRTARLLAAGHGGQILVSQVTEQLVREALPPDVTLRPLGEFRLRNLTRPESIYQLVAPGLPVDFPALRTVGIFRHNLPPDNTRFVGRERELAEIRRLLETQTALLTLTGPGGVGKTRLSLQAAAQLLDIFEDGVWLVELATLTDPALVPQAVATAIGAHEEAGRPLLATLGEHLTGKRVLLVLDNCEHLVEACAQLVAELLRRSPSLRILASSRERLGVAGEIPLRIPPLSLPPERFETGQPVDLLMQSDAVRLFVERARLADPRFSITPHNAAVVAEICARLDGIALAIELAAARVKMMSLEQLDARLDDRFRLLIGGSRAYLPHQRTLRALIDWSHDLLDDDERVLFRRLAVFAGGATLAAAEAVCAAAPLADWQILDVLGRLESKSLLVLSEREDEVRFGMLDTIRSYALEKLEQSGETAATRDRHMAVCLELAERADPLLRGAEQEQWFERLDAELDNLREAFNWAIAGRRAAEALRMTAALGYYWNRRGLWSEGLERADKALALAAPDATPRAYGRALISAGMLAQDLGHYADAGARFARAAEISTAAGDTYGSAHATRGLAEARMSQGAGAEAEALFEQALALSQACDDRWGTALVLNILGWHALDRGDNGRAAVLYQQSLELYRAIGDRSRIALLLGGLALAAINAGEIERAAELVNESLALRRALKDAWGVAASLDDLGRVALLRGDYARAREHLTASLREFWRMGDKGSITYRLEALAWLDALEGRATRGARLAGAAAGVREALGGAALFIYRSHYEQMLAALHAQLDDAAFAAAFAAGRHLSVEQAVNEALQPG